jgi:SAM-dependent methyltransferase
MSALVRVPHATRFRLRGALIVHNDLTGRTARLAGDALATWRRFGDTPREPAEVIADGGDPATIDALVRLGLLVEQGASVAAQVLDRFPVRARFATFAVRPDGTILLTERTGPPDAPWQARPLSAIEGFVWARCDGRASTRALLDQADAAGGPEAAHAAARILARWTHSDLQLVKMLDEPADPTRAPPPHVFSWIFHLPVADDDAPGPPVDLTAYHEEEIVDADDQFDERETTLSHLLRDPSPALGGRSWGEALAHALVDRGAPLRAGARVVEVGGGTGWVARRVTETIPGLEYTIVDLSPALQRAQRARLGDAARYRLGDATALPLPDASVDVLLSNEVIADLAAERVDPAAPPDVVARLGVVPSAPRVTNTGALRFLEQIHRVLAPGGFAYVSEYGERDGEPMEAEHLDHPEVGIEFDVLARAARQLGFARVEIVDAVDLLAITDAPVLSVPPEQHRALRALVAALGGTPPPKRALTPPELRAFLGDVDPRALHQLAWTPARERIMSFRPRRILALLLVKPAP